MLASVGEVLKNRAHQGLIVRDRHSGSEWWKLGVRKPVTCVKPAAGRWWCHVAVHPLPVTSNGHRSVSSRSCQGACPNLGCTVTR